jgi:secreted PhoX family phosphatase
MKSAMKLTRRSFLTLAGLGMASAAFADPLRKTYGQLARGKSPFSRGLGKLNPDPNGILDLPAGFRYKILSQMGRSMDDRTPVPTAFDGMGAIAGENGATILIRNHELSPDEQPAVLADRALKYDPLSQGGTTTLVIDRDRNLKREYVSLAGTNRNCAGGTTPWGTWISCEEDVSTPQTNQPDDPRNVSKKHGYAFEVTSAADSKLPVPLTAMGRFRREAIAVDPQTGYIYQTEDRNDSCLYRFRPHSAGQLSQGGSLEALVLSDRPAVDTSRNFPVGRPFAVEWVAIADPDPDDDSLRFEAQRQGAAIFKRGEGICFAGGELFWTCTSGGNAESGQIFRYNPAKNELSLFAESPGAGVLDYPDNIIQVPWGDLMVCEDGGGEQFLVGISPNGEYYHFARNALNTSEFAGICCSADGKTVFVNIYSPGLTLAIWRETA